MQDPEVVGDDELRGAADRYFRHLQAWVTDVLEAGRAAGELRPDADTGAAAAMIVAVVQGGFVLARAQQDAAPQQAAIRGALAALGALRAGEP